MSSIQNTSVALNSATASSLWKGILAKTSTDSFADLQVIEQIARISNESAQVSFGTSGWRGELGVEFTLRNVQLVAAAIVDMYKEASAELLEVLGVSGFAELQKSGVIIGHDNRLLGADFARAMAVVFAEHGVKVFYAGEASTPEFSAGIEMLNAAAAVNITPSHNPANYSGVKFNPKDGGPAGPEITSVITAKSNALMSSWTLKEGEPEWTQIDILSLYQDFLVSRNTLELDKIRALAHSGKIDIVVDNVHGSTRGRPQFLLQNPKNLVALRTEDNLLFGGIAPEPSSKNMVGVLSALGSSQTEFKLGVIFDPDGDRIRFYDGVQEIDMNQFGALAFHYLAVHRKLNGVVAKSVATSNFVNAIAKGLGVELVETEVGFKNFRPLLRKGCSPMALIAFEESDGISGFNNTIEKDAQFGLLLALEMIANTQKRLGAYLKEVQDEFGYFYPERSGFEVEKSQAGPGLLVKVSSLAARVQPGTEVAVGQKIKKVAEVITLDGVKVIFEDQSWMLIRASGTEPKIRVYTECREASEKNAMFEAGKALFASLN